MKQVARQQKKNTPRTSEVHNSQQGLSAKICLKKKKGYKIFTPKKP